MSETIETDVIIVGAGPVGLTLSYILGKSNVDNIVVEKNLTTCDWPKTYYIDPRSMELFNHIGLDKHIRDVSLPENFMAGYCASLTKEPPLALVKFTEEFVEKVHKTAEGFVMYVEEEISSEKPCRISQIQTEQAMKEATEDLPSCNIHYGWQLKTALHDEDGVTAEVVLQSGETKTIEGRFLVGCDGAESFVIKSVGINYTGHFNVGKIRSIFFKSTELRKRLYNPELMAYVITRQDFHATVAPVDTEQLFIAQIIIEADRREKPAEYYIRSILDKDISFQILKDHSCNADIVHAESFQFGRMILAGNAGHHVVPIAGIAMNCGIADAFNLGWKLVATVQGWGGEWLLDSYTSESVRFYKKVINGNRKDFQRVVKSKNKTGTFLRSTSPFKYFFRLISKCVKSMGNEGLLFGVMLQNSPVCVPSGLEGPIEEREYYISEPYSACRAPHFKFQDGSTLFSKLGDMFTLLCLSPCTETCKFLGKYAKEAGLPLKVLTFDDKDLRKLFKMKMVLIRPDMYIAWCGDEIPQLTESDSLRTRARVLINVVSGATPLPPEWAWSRVKKVAPLTIKPRSHYWIVPLVSVLICLVGIATYSAVL